MNAITDSELEIEKALHESKEKNGFPMYVGLDPTAGTFRLVLKQKKAYILEIFFL